LYVWNTPEPFVKSAIIFSPLIMLTPLRGRYFFLAYVFIQNA
jgi:hypothetical protein